MSPPPAAHTNARPQDVRLLGLDVDGVMTDGSILLDADGRELKRFNSTDGVGIRAWLRLGFGVAIITGRSGAAVRQRAADLGIPHVILGSRDKGTALDELARVSGTPTSAMAFLADDWPDLPVLRRVGYPMAVANAAPQVRRASAFVTTSPGGHGAVREAIEHLLMAKGLLDEAVRLYDAG